MHNIEYKKRYILYLFALMIFEFFASNSSSQELPPGMVAYWKFDEGSGVIAYDFSQANHATIHGGATWTTGQVGGALNLTGDDGIAGYVVAPDSVNLNPSNISIEAWIKLSTPAPDWGAALVEKDGWNGGRTGYALLLGNWGQGNTIRFELLTPPSSYISVDSLTQLEPGEWYHVVATYDGNRMRIYINGSIDNSLEYSGTINLGNDGILGIGARFLNNDVNLNEISQHIDGTVDEIAIYNRGLTIEEIQKHYNNGLNGIGYTSFSVINATIDINPGTINLKSSGNFITAYIELPELSNAEDINISTIRLDKLNGNMLTCPLNVLDLYEIGDFDSNGTHDLMIKFDRQNLISLLPNTGDISINISGKLVDGSSFEGTKTVRVINKGTK